jgi:hypothetical protein
MIPGLIEAHAPIKEKMSAIKTTDNNLMVTPYLYRNRGQAHRKSKPSTGTITLIHPKPQPDLRTHRCPTTAQSRSSGSEIRCQALVKPLKQMVI